MMQKPSPIMVLQFFHV